MQVQIKLIQVGEDERMRKCSESWRTLAIISYDIIINHNHITSAHINIIPPMKYAEQMRWLHFSWGRRNP